MFWWRIQFTIYNKITLFLNTIFINIPKFTQNKKKLQLKNFKPKIALFYLDKVMLVHIFRL